MSHLGPSLRRRAPRRSGARRALVALALSLLVNLLLLGRVDLSWVGQAAGPRRAVALAPLALREWEANRAVASGPSAPRPPPAQATAPLDLPQPTPQGQVVMADRPKEPPKEPPRDARFLAEFDSQVEKETRSRKIGQGGSAKESPQVAGGPRGKPDAREARPEARARPEPQQLLAFDWRPRADLQKGMMSTREPPAPGEAGPRGRPDADGSERRPDLRASAAPYLTVDGGGNPSKIDGVDEGDATYLNTREWRYAGFFNRIGAEVYPYWVREFRTAAHDRDPTAQRFLYRDRETQVAVKLDTAGKLLDIRVAKSSGAPFLDEAVLKAWRETQPFANVPKGLANDRGEIVFAWSYTIYGASGSPVQLYLGPARY